MMNCKLIEPRAVYTNAAEIDYDSISEIELHRLADAFLRIYTDMIEKKNEGSGGDV
ncbi:MAG: hypothetical protein ACLRQ0_14075 [Monoglobales bacterium]